MFSGCFVRVNLEQTRRRYRQLGLVGVFWNGCYKMNKRFVLFSTAIMESPFCSCAFNSAQAYTEIYNFCVCFCTCSCADLSTKKWNCVVRPPVSRSEPQNESTELFSRGHTAGWRQTEINDGALGSSYLVGLVLSSIAKSFYLCVVWNFCSSSVSDPGTTESIEVRLINPGLRRVLVAESSTKCLVMTQVGIVWK